MNRRMALTVAVLLGTGCFGQTKIDYPSQIRNGPVVIDTAYATLDLGCAAAAAAHATLNVTKHWDNVPTTHCNAVVNFVGSSARIEPADAAIFFSNGYTAASRQAVWLVDTTGVVRVTGSGTGSPIFAGNFSTFFAACDTASVAVSTLTVSTPMTVAATTVCAANVNALADGLLSISNGATLTLTGAFSGDGSQHFDTTPGGVVAFSYPAVVTVNPAWFGTSPTATDNGPAFIATYAALPANGGTVSAPGGDCYKTGKITLPSYPKTLMFSGTSSLATCLVAANTNQSMFDVTSPLPSDFPSSYNTFGNFTIRANTAGADASHPAIDMRGMNNNIWDNINFESNGSGKFALGALLDDGTVGRLAGYQDTLRRWNVRDQNGPTTLVKITNTSNGHVIDNFSVTGNSGMGNIIEIGPGAIDVKIENSDFEGNGGSSQIVPGGHTIIDHVHMEDGGAAATWNIDGDGTTGTGAQAVVLRDNQIEGINPKIRMRYAVNWFLSQNVSGGGIDGYFSTPATSPVSSLFQFGSVLRNVTLGSIAGGFRATQVSAPGFAGNQAVVLSSPGLGAGSYSWWAAAYDGNGHSTSTEIAAAVLSAPSTVSVGWIPVNGAKEYHVFRCPSTVLGVCDSPALYIATIYSSLMCGLQGGCTYFNDDGTIMPAGENKPSVDTTGSISAQQDISADRDLAAGRNLAVTGTSAFTGNATFSGDQTIVGSCPSDNAIVCIVKTSNSILGPQLGVLERTTSNATATSFIGHDIDTALAAGATATTITGLAVSAPTKGAGATVTNAATASFPTPTIGSSTNYAATFPSEGGGGKKVLCLDNNGGLTFVAEGSCH